MRPCSAVLLVVSEGGIVSSLLSQMLDMLYSFYTTRGCIMNSIFFWNFIDVPTVCSYYFTDPFNRILPYALPKVQVYFFLPVSILPA